MVYIIIQMFISYFDSSGRPIYRQDPENYVVASVTVNEHHWNIIRNDITDLKEKHFPKLNPESVEFHAKDMMNRDGIYKNIGWQKIYSIFDDIFSVISDKDTQLTIIASLIKKAELRKQIDLEIWGYRFVFERINKYLNQRNEALLEAGMPHEYGIMIMDSEGKTKDQKLRDKLVEMLREGTFYSKLDYLIEDPLFTDSKWRNLSQIVDCVAYCIRKHYRNNKSNNHTTNWNRYFTMIENKFHNVNGKYLGYGVKIFPD